MGVYLQGAEARQVVLRTRIDHLNGVGIRVHRGNKSKIKGCDISYCLTGIEVISADPLIVMNHIRQNIENGIVTIAKDFIRCDSTIKFNYIEKNKECGILCAGANNFTRIEKNPCISTNRKAGIKSFECAQIAIIKNKVFGNFSQGILLVEGTSAHVE